MSDKEHDDMEELCLFLWGRDQDKTFSKLYFLFPKCTCFTLQLF